MRESSQELEPTPRKSLLLYRAVVFDFAESFMLQIFILVVNAWYGVMQVIVRRAGAPSIKGSVNAIDFGQVIPVFLLILSILTASELYFESHTGHILRTCQLLHPNSPPPTEPSQQMKEDHTSPQIPASTSFITPEYITSRSSSSVEGLDISISSASTLPPPVSRIDSSSSHSGTPRVESGDALTEDSKLISVYLYPYSRPEAQRALAVLAVITIIISAFIGITLSAAELTRLMAIPSVVPAVILFAEKVIGHTRFILHVIGEVRKLKKQGWMIPAGGTRAPAPSIFEGHGV